MKKSTSLKTKWTFTTTVFTFITLMLFSVILILMTGNILLSQEMEKSRENLLEVGKLMDTKTPGTLIQSDILSKIAEGEKIYMYNMMGKKQIEIANNNDVDDEPKFVSGPEGEKGIEMLDGERYIVQRIPYHATYSEGYITLIHPLASYDRYMHILIIFASLFGIMALFVSAVISYLFSNQITRPIRSLSSQMKQIQRDGFQNQLAMPKAYYETDDMIETFNKLMNQLENSFNLQKQFVEDASHELRTPLQIIQGHLNLIKRWGKNNPDVMEESLSISIDEMNRITKLVEELLLLTKETKNHEQAELDTISVNDEIKTRVKSLSQIHEDYHFEVYTSEHDINLKINRYQFEQMLLIFLDNAIKYDQKEKHIIVRSSVKNKIVQIEIIDHGTGIPAEDLPHVFDRFYRVDKSRARTMGGNGLGLSIAKKIIESYDGNVLVESQLNQYTKITIQFPENVI